MRGFGGSIGRFLFTLALIVQIVAPVRASVAMVTVATDPLIEIVVCGADQQVLDRRSGHDPIAANRGAACALCQIVAASGFAPPPPAPIVTIEIAIHPASTWVARVEPIVASRHLDRIRARAPPIIS